MEFPQEENSARSPESQKASKTVGQPERYLDSRGSGRTHGRTDGDTNRTKRTKKVFDLGSRLGEVRYRYSTSPEGVRL